MEKITYFRFLSEIKAFLKKLMEDPIGAKPSQYLMDRNFNRTKTINVLMKAGVLERSENVKDQTDSDVEKPTYFLKFKVKKKDFERKIKKIYIKYFEKNLPKKDEVVNECEGGCGGEGGAIGGGEASGVDAGSATDGATSSQINMGHPDMPFGLVRREFMPVQGRGPKEKKKGKNIKPENILGKELTAECKKCNRKIHITEEQYNLIMEDGVTSTATVGAIGDYTAGGLVLKTADGKEDPCATAGRIKVRQLK